MDRDQQMQLYLMQQQQQMLQSANANAQPLSVQEAQQRLSSMHPAGQFRPRPLQGQAPGAAPQYMPSDMDIRRMQAAQQMRPPMQQPQPQRPPMTVEQAAYARSMAAMSAGESKAGGGVGSMQMPMMSKPGEMKQQSPMMGSAMLQQQNRMTPEQAGLRAAMARQQAGAAHPGVNMKAPPAMKNAAMFRPMAGPQAGRSDAASFFQKPQVSGPPPTGARGPVRPGTMMPNRAQGNAGQAQRTAIDSGPQQYMAQLIERVKAEKEGSLGNEQEYERSRKRPLENEERLFWNQPLPARLVAGLSLLEADSSLTLGHAMGGANDIWSALDPMPSPMSCGGSAVPGLLRFGGVESYKMAASQSASPQEYLYTECSLSGLIDEAASPGAAPALCKILHSLADVAQKGLWKDECWRLDVNDSNQMTYLQSPGKCARELWLRRYLLPEHLRNIFALRVYSAQYLAVPPHFPTNARRVKEATVAPSIVSIIDGIGFQRSPPNDVYVKGVLYHLEAGTNRHIIVTVTKIFSTRYMTDEVFPGKIFVEAKGRTEKDSLMNSVATALVELAARLKPHVNLLKV